MALRVDGIPDESIVTKTVDFFCRVLNIPSDIDIHLFVDETLQSQGACYQNSPSEYMIVLACQKIEQMIVTIAHELVHIKQFIYDELDKHFDDSIPYHERWWEQEASESESVLMELFLNEMMGN